MLDQLRGGVEEAIATLGRASSPTRPTRAPRGAARRRSSTPRTTTASSCAWSTGCSSCSSPRIATCCSTRRPTEARRERYSDIYSTARLRRLAERRRGTPHPTSTRPCALVMERLGSDPGCPELALPALGSFLFSPEAIADLARLPSSPTPTCSTPSASWPSTSDGQRRPARGLPQPRLRGTRQRLRVAPGTPPGPERRGAATFALTTAAGHERKTTGSYYTPTSLITCLLDSALDPVLDEAVAQPRPRGGDPAPSRCATPPAAAGTS